MRAHSCLLRDSGLQGSILRKRGGEFADLLNSLVKPPVVRRLE